MLLCLRPFRRDPAGTGRQSKQKKTKKNKTVNKCKQSSQNEISKTEIRAV